MSVFRGDLIKSKASASDSRRILSRSPARVFRRGAWGWRRASVALKIGLSLQFHTAYENNI